MRQLLLLITCSWLFMVLMAFIIRSIGNPIDRFSHDEVYAICRLFMQYVNSGALQLTGDFMAQVLKGEFFISNLRLILVAYLCISLLVVHLHEIEIKTEFL